MDGSMINYESYLYIAKVMRATTSKNKCPTT